MWKVIKESYQDLIALTILVSMIILAMHWHYTKSTLGIKEWSKFKKQTKVEHKFIKDVTIFSGGGRTVFIKYVMGNKSNLTEVKGIFEETKRFLFSEKIFLELEKYQHEKYPNDFYEICIRFYSGECIIPIYEFQSVANGKNEGVKRYENFKSWSMNKDGKYEDVFQSD